MASADTDDPRIAEDLDEGYEKALDMLGECATEHGYVASTQHRSNYRRVWGRDGCIMGLAALMSGDSELIDQCKLTLRTLKGFQGPHGETPSNVDPDTHRVSYGGTAGRVDSNLWFIVCCGQYWRQTQDEAFLDEFIGPVENTRYLLDAWEFNNRGLLYVPPTGDWADEYVQSGYVLYDQILYYQAQREICRMHEGIHGSVDHQLKDEVVRLKDLICANYWFTEDGTTPDHVYHEVLYEKGRDAAPKRDGQYWMPFFMPLGYGYRFDSMANSLVSLVQISCEDHDTVVDDYIDTHIVNKDMWLLPAFHPVITPKDEAWDELQMSFSHTFKNEPYEYHNGGLWPMVTGFYAASLAARGDNARAMKYANGINRANAMEVNGEPWSFPEYIHGKNLTPGGTCPVGWSAAAAVIATQHIRGNTLFGS